MCVVLQQSTMLWLKADIIEHVLGTPNCKYSSSELKCNVHVHVTEFSTLDSNISFVFSDYTTVISKLTIKTVNLSQTCLKFEKYFEMKPGPLTSV